MKGKIFNAQEVQSILSGNKTQFREVIKRQPCDDLRNGNIKYNEKHNSFYFENGKDIFNFSKCPYQAGQKIFCKESFWEAGGNIIYRADYESYKPISPWRRAMKQEHSRLFPLIKEIRVERLQDISEEDAIAEGVSKIGFHELLNREASNGFLSRISGKKYQYYPQEFKKLWNATHKKPEEKFEANPWVWVVNFEVVND